QTSKSGRIEMLAPSLGRKLFEPLDGFLEMTAAIVGERFSKEEISPPGMIFRARDAALSQSFDTRKIRDRVRRQSTSFGGPFVNVGMLRHQLVGSIEQLTTGVPVTLDFAER